MEEDKTNQQSNILFVKDVARMLGYCEDTIRLYVRKGFIPHYRRGTRIFFNREEVEQWVFKNKATD